MKSGNILCVCGESFYVETVFDSVICLSCGFKHDVSMFPNKEDVENVQEETVDELLEEEAETIADSAK